jgi:hypothetical protein
MPHIIHNLDNGKEPSAHNVEAAPVKAIASQELEDKILAELEVEDKETVTAIFKGGEVFGSVDVPHTICGHPYDKCCHKNKDNQ